MRKEVVVLGDHLAKPIKVLHHCKGCGTYYYVEMYQIVGSDVLAYTPTADPSCPMQGESCFGDAVELVTKDQVATIAN